MTDPKKKTAIAWPTAAVLLALIVGNVLIALLAPATDRLALMAAYSLTVGTVLAFMRGMLGGAALVLVLSLALGGCGASASQTSARAVTVAAGIAQGAARVVTSGADADFEATCPRATYPDQASATACAVPVRARWAPADAAIGSTRAALVAWLEMTQVAHLAGDDGSLWAPLALAAARLVAEYDALRAVLAPLDVDLPAMPSIVADLAASIGGQ